MTGALDVIEGLLAPTPDSVRLKPGQVRLKPGQVRLKPDSTGHSTSRPGNGGLQADRRTPSGRVRLQPDSDPELHEEVIAALARRTRELRDDVRFLARAGDTDYVYFVEFRGRGVFLRAAPIDVSAILRQVLFDRLHTTVLTSATLAVDGTFEYSRRRLGVRATPTFYVNGTLCDVSFGLEPLERAVEKVLCWAAGGSPLGGTARPTKS